MRQHLMKLGGRDLRATRLRIPTRRLARRPPYRMQNYGALRFKASLMQITILPFSSQVRLALHSSISGQSWAGLDQMLSGGEHSSHTSECARSRVLHVLKRGGHDHAVVVTAVAWPDADQLVGRRVDE